MAQRPQLQSFKVGGSWLARLADLNATDDTFCLCGVTSYNCTALARPSVLAAITLCLTILSHATELLGLRPDSSSDSSTGMDESIARPNQLAADMLPLLSAASTGQENLHVPSGLAVDPEEELAAARAGSARRKARKAGPSPPQRCSCEPCISGPGLGASGRFHSAGSTLEDSTEAQQMAEGVHTKHEATEARCRPA